MANRVLTQPRDTGAVRSLKRGLKLEVDSERIDALAEWAEENILQHHKSHELVARVRSLSLVPLGRLYGRLPKMIEDLAQSLGKHVNPIELEGADVALYARVFNMVANALVHLLRNCVDHGIEDPDVRIQSGRSSHGSIALRCVYDADQLCLAVEDDGAGIDADKLVLRAREKGLISPAESPRGQEALQLIFMPGFSTAEEVTEISGRGVGMDVVKNLIEELQGSIRIDTELGRGTTFHVVIPTSIALGTPQT